MTIALSDLDAAIDPHNPYAHLISPSDVRAMGPVSQFCVRNFKHFNAGQLVGAANAYRQHLDQGGYMMVTLAGAMSTGELGISLAEMIRQDKIHAISCTGANLEEDVFNLIGHYDYEPVPQYRDLTAQDEQDLRDEGLNRVTDTTIPDDKVVNPVVEAITWEWKRAEKIGTSRFPHEYLYAVLLSGVLKDKYQIDPKDSWMLAAAEKHLPIVVPGWEDSTLGNAFCAALLRGDLHHGGTVKNGIDYMRYLTHWYAKTAPKHPVGFFQIGGGIAGDFPICVVPMLRLELGHEDMPLWGYFCQIRDSTTSYGGYSGAVPGEKITWNKLGPETPVFDIESDATIVWPLIAALVLGD
jgi:deoxyhypusine synthase